MNNLHAEDPKVMRELLQSFMEECQRRHEYSRSRLQPRQEHLEQLRQLRSQRESTGSQSQIEDAWRQLSTTLQNIREGGREQPPIPPETRSRCGQSGSMYVSRATFMELQF